jgi:hypothetical protein
MHVEQMWPSNPGSAYASTAPWVATASRRKCHFQTAIVNTECYVRHSMVANVVPTLCVPGHWAAEKGGEMPQLLLPYHFREFV